MISEITDAICVIDHENRVVWVNKTFEEWFSNHGSLLGKNIEILFKDIGEGCIKGAVFSDIDINNRKRYFEVECVPTYDDKGMKVSNLIAFRDVTVLQTLLNISYLTVTTSTSKDLLGKALDIIGETLGYKTIAALLHTDGVLDLVDSRGYSPMLNMLLARQKVSADEKGLAGQSAYQKKVILKEIKEGTVSEKLLRESRRLGITSVVTVPLVDRGELIGVMAISTSIKPTIEEINLLKIVCNQISVSLRKIIFEENLVGARNEIELYIDLMCHDITNANQVALGYLEFIQGKPKEEIDQYISFAMSSIYRVNSLIDNVRKLRGIHPDHIGAMNIRSSMDEAINDAFFLADNIKKSVTINMNISPVYFVRANNLLKDIFYNILEFIMRRINDGGTIDIFVNEKENSYDIIFDDSGPGVKTMNRWFAVYDDFSKAPRTGQLGLGMYLVKNVAHRFNGSVFLEDRIKGDINKGNRCILTLKKV